MPDTPTVTPLVDEELAAFARKLADDLRHMLDPTDAPERLDQIADRLAALRPVDDAGLIERVEAFASWLETLHYKNLAVHDSPTLRASDLRAIVAVLASSEKEVGRLRGALEHIQRMNLDDRSTYDLCAAALKGRVVEGEK